LSTSWNALKATVKQHHIHNCTRCCSTRPLPERISSAPMYSYFNPGRRGGWGRKNRNWIISYQLTLWNPDSSITHCKRRQTRNGAELTVHVRERQKTALTSNHQLHTGFDSS